MRRVIFLIGLIILVGCSDIDKYNEPINLTNSFENLVEGVRRNNELAYLQGYRDCQIGDNTTLDLLNEKYLNTSIPTNKNKGEK